jgi:pyrrolysine biosynthesis protein PylD
VTRLITADIIDITANLKNYDIELVARTGYSLSGIACCASGIDEARIKNLLPDIRVGVIPISSGKGIIGGFCDAVLSILLHMGCNAFITRTTDVAGIAESFEEKADIIMLANDERFVALDIRSRSIADNAVCTGRRSEGAGGAGHRLWSGWPQRNGVLDSHGRQDFGLRYSY